MILILITCFLVFACVIVVKNSEEVVGLNKQIGRKKRKKTSVTSLGKEKTVVSRKAKEENNNEKEKFFIKSNSSSGTFFKSKFESITNPRTNKYSTVKNAPLYEAFVSQVLEMGIFISSEDCNDYLVEILKYQDYIDASAIVINQIENECNKMIKGSCRKFNLHFRVNEEDNLMIINENENNNIIYISKALFTDMSATAIMYRIYCDIFDYGDILNGVKVSRLSMKIDKYTEDYTKEDFLITYELNL